MRLSEERYKMAIAAKIAGVHVGTVWRWYLAGVKGRKLRTVLVGGRRYVLKRDLEQFLTGDGCGDPETADGNDDSETIASSENSLSAGEMLDRMMARTTPKRSTPR